MLPHLTRFSSGVALCLAAAALSFTSAQAESLSSWTSLKGKTTGLGTNSPVIGNGGDSSASDEQIYASFEKQTLSNTGESLKLSGSVAFSGVTGAQADQFRFGIYDVNGKSNTNGWLGYFATNSGSPTGGSGAATGRLWERDSGNNNNFGSGTGATVLSYVAGAPSNGAFGDGDYDLSMVLTRTDTGLEISWSLTSDTYSLTGTFLDTTPLTYGFDRVGFFSGGGLPASQIAFSGLQIEFSPAIPEPATTALIGAALVLGVSMIVRRRRRG